MPELDAGAVTLFFSDIEGSTRLEVELGTARYIEIRQLQRRILRREFEAAGGHEQGTEGDSFFVTFPSPDSAVRAAIAGQRALAGAAWPGGARARIRMGIHSGVAVVSDDGTYAGLDINRAARIAAAAHGEQIIVSDAARAALASVVDRPFELRELGRHRLKDLPEPEPLFQVVAPGLRLEFPPLRTIDNRPNNLPVSVSSFIGRAREVEDARRLLRRARLVNLTGPGGTGKTRLAQAVGREALADAEDGVFWVGLAAISDPDLVGATIAATLGVPDIGDRPIVDALAESVGDRELILILDNFEQVLPAASIISQLLERAPRLRFLVTSRALLRLSGEHEFPVPPLELPDPAHPPGHEALLRNEAVALFVDRAIAARPDFTPTPELSEAIARICARLDGLPLAIELAAARVRVLSPPAILARLEDALGLLGGGGRDLPARQQTLRGAIAWSHDLLEPVERIVFARLSVFAGGCSLDAATAACDVEGALGPAILDVLESLVEKSLLRQAEVGDEPRFRMLQVIREFAAERFAEDPRATAIRDRHLAFFADLAGRAEPHLTLEDSTAWLDRLDLEHDNIRAALRWSRDTGAAEAGLAMAGGLWRFWHQRGHLREGRSILRDLLALPDAEAHPAARAKALNGAGGLAYWQNDFAAAVSEYEEALATYRRIGDRTGEADVLLSLGYLALIDRQLDLGRERLEASRATSAALGDRLGVARALAALVMLGWLTGDVDEVRRTSDQAFPLLRELGERFGLATAMSVRGRAEFVHGSLDRAEEMLLESLRLFFEAADPADSAMLLDDLGALALRRGAPERAVRLAAASKALREQIGGGAPRSLVLPLDYLDEARDSIGNERWTEAWSQGASMDLEASVRYALEASTAGGQDASAGIVP